MSHTALDRIWFAMALALLAGGFVSWWARSPTISSPVASGSMLAVWLSTGLLVLCWWRWSTVATSATGRGYLAPLALAVTAPLSMVPLVDWRGDPASIVGLVVSGLAGVPLAWVLAGWVIDPSRRVRTRLAALGLAGAGVLMGWLVGNGDIESFTRFLRWVAVAGTAMVPAVVVAFECLRGPQRVPMAGQRRLLDALVVLAVGAAPGVAALCLSMRAWPVLLVPLVAAGFTAVVLVRFALLPLARLASSASVQRDRVVAAAETERIRLASVLHDGPLADIALLIQRLDDRGDIDSAAIARGVADELRAVGSELRLPVLDDLGTGPALEWLVGRLTQRSGVPVQLRQMTTARPPASVELAAYRVAQEALVNALKYGAAPIVVRYVATLASVTLSVDDSGPGIDRDAAARADREGRLGLASMAQRAEAIGAQLILGGSNRGAHVGLEWRAIGA